MTGELGQLALCFALALSLVMAAAGLTGSRADAATARSIAHGATMGMLVFVALAFGTLTYAFVVSDFSLALVPAVPPLSRARPWGHFVTVCEEMVERVLTCLGGQRRAWRRGAALNFERVFFLR